MSGSNAAWWRSLSASFMGDLSAPDLDISEPMDSARVGGLLPLLVAKLCKSCSVILIYIEQEEDEVGMRSGAVPAGCPGRSQAWPRGADQERYNVAEFAFKSNHLMACKNSTSQLSKTCGPSLLTFECHQSRHAFKRFRLRLTVKDVDTDESSEFYAWQARVGLS